MLKPGSPSRRVLVNPATPRFHTTNLRFSDDQIFAASQDIEEIARKRAKNELANKLQPSVQLRISKRIQNSKAKLATSMSSLSTTSSQTFLAKRSGYKFSLPATLKFAFYGVAFLGMCKLSYDLLFVRKSSVSSKINTAI